MKPKDKAEKLFYDYLTYFPEFRNDLEYDYNVESAKNCALIAVDELIEATKKYVALREKVEYSKTGYDNVVHTQYDKFWQEVKQEIENL